jgi:ABC-type protease/lipase transport system fused ATPase/permease subunit
MVSHRPNALSALNQTLVLYEGKAIAFGPREEVFERVARSAGARVQPAPAPPRAKAPLVAAGAPQ